MAVLRRVGHGVRWGWHLAVLGAAVLVLVRVARPTSGAGQFAYLAVSGGAAAAAAIAARRGPTDRRVPTLIAVGLALSFAADAGWEVMVALDGYGPDVSLLDLGWIGSYLALAGALLRLLRGAGERIDVDGYIDIAAVFVLGLFLQWQLILEDLLADTSVSLGVRLLWAAYPIGDVVLLALVVRLALARQVRGTASAFLAAGAACWLLSDTAYTVLATEGPLAGWLDAGWLVGGGLMAAAAWQISTPSRPIDDDLTEGVGYARLAVAVVPLPLPVAFEVAGHLNGSEPNPYVLGGATAALLAIATARAIRILRVLGAARGRIEAQERFARRLAENSSDAFALLDTRGTILNDDPSLAAILGCPGTSVEGRSMLEFIDDAGLTAAEDAFDRSLAEPGQRHQLELQVKRPDGRQKWVGARVVNLLDDPAVGGVLVHLHDITSRKRAEDELVHQAFHDPLTGLANRALFSDRVEHAIDRAGRTGRQPAVIYIDLDGFKAVNDTLGHAAGDRLLQEVARRLTTAVRDGDTLARLGGDEFAVLVEESLRPMDDAAAVADRVLETLRAPIEIDGHWMPVTASTGVATGDERTTATSLVRDADVAMYAAKAAGKARWYCYDPALRADAAERLELERDLAGALARRELRLVYQPVVALEASTVIGFEALIRWDHPTFGTLLPERFIPIAEENGLIEPIGRWVLAEACRAAARWRRNHFGAGDLGMSVNVSTRQLLHTDLVGDVANVLTQSGLPATSLILEVTETALGADIEAAAEQLGRVRDLGVRIAIDDFGTGSSSLGYLHRFPVDILKIDRSFVSAMEEESAVPAMVRGLLNLGRTLDLVTIAEGVELDFQAQLLRDSRCSHAQGFYFAKPLEPQEVELLLLQQTAGSLPIEPNRVG